MLPQSYPNYKTVHRRFQAWCHSDVLRQVLTDVANELRDKGMLDEEESFIDATFAMAKGGGAEIGPTKRGKGMKIMAIVDRHGLPLSVSTHAANHHEVRLVQLCFDFYMIEAKPEILIGDRAYDSDPLDDDLRKDGIEMIAPHRSNRRKCPTQDGRRLRRYARRWLVERFFAWLQWQRRILVRWEFHPKNFLGFGNPPASSSSSNDFEIGSSYFPNLPPDLARPTRPGDFFVPWAGRNSHLRDLQDFRQFRDIAQRRADRLHHRQRIGREPGTRRVFEISAEIAGARDHRRAEGGAPASRRRRALHR